MIEDMKTEEQKDNVKKKIQNPECIDLIDDTHDLIVLDETIEEDSEEDLDEQKMEHVCDEDRTTDLNDINDVSQGGGEVAESSTTVLSTPSRQKSCSSSTNSVSKTEPGTPICEMFSPFSRLPQQEQFGKDM